MNAVDSSLTAPTRKPRLRRLNNRNTLIAIDTAVVAATNAGVLVAGARLVPTEALVSLAMFQLLVATAVGLQRATILTPALSAQRTDGTTAIPYSWIAYITLPLAIASAFAIPLLVAAAEPYLEVVGLALVVVSAALVQDLLRYAQFSRGRTGYALISDAVWFVCLAITVGLMFVVSADSWFLLAALWGAGAVLAIVVVVVLALMAPAHDFRRSSLRSTLRLGRWSGADAALSGAANLLPMAVATLALGSSAAAIYRILQTAAGPFNIISATFITSFGLDAWKLREAASVRALRKTARRAALRLLVVSAVYYGMAFVVLALIAGLSGPEVVRVAVILGFAGVLGAVTIPFMAAATAMGYQRVGFIVRVFIVVASLGVSVAAAMGVWVPWDDPIGVVAIVSATAGLVGWVIGYERGYRRELREIGSHR